MARWSGRRINGRKTDRDNYFDTWIFRWSLVVLMEYASNKKLKFKISCPFRSADYRPELDSTALLEPDMISRYQHLIGILRWACDLGRLDILLEVALLRSFSAAPRQGHYDQVYNIFSYIKVHR